jgi:hypothetical protein
VKYLLDTSVLFAWIWAFIIPWSPGARARPLGFGRFGGKARDEMGDVGWPSRSGNFASHSPD